MLNMADGCLLLVDAVEGPMPQTRFVLRKAMALGLQADHRREQDRPGQRAPAETVEATHDLLLELAKKADQLECAGPLYERARRHRNRRPHHPAVTLEPLLDALLTRTFRLPLVTREGCCKLMVSNLDHDNHIGGL